MSSIIRSKEIAGDTSPSDRKDIMQEPRWQACKNDIGISQAVLDEYFDFLNSGVVIRSSAEGIPLMTTTGIFGPIQPDDTIVLKQGFGSGAVVEVQKEPVENALLEELKMLRATHNSIAEDHSVLVNAKWVSGSDGGGLPNVGKSANVFGATGSLLVNESEVVFPVVRPSDSLFDASLAFYGAKLLAPNTPFKMGFDKPLFGMEYDTVLPGYIQDYVMQEWGGGGLFVEHHPFPHIWFPNPRENEKGSNVCRILLGRIVETDEEDMRNVIADKVMDCCPPRAPKDQALPQYHFTVFEIPSDDGHALAVDECCIHNDSFCNGRQVVFLADTDANTVAWRESSAYKNLRISA